MSYQYSYATDDATRLSVDDVLGLIDWKELEDVLTSPDDTSRPPVPVDEPTSMDVAPAAVAPAAKAITTTPPARRNRKSSRAKVQAPTATTPPKATGVPAAPAATGPLVKKKRIRREIVELKFLRSKAKELEEQLRELQLGFSTSSADPASLEGIMPSVWTSIAGRQLKDRMRAERENQELRNMLQDQLRIAKGLEETLKQLPPSQSAGSPSAPLLPPDIFGPSSSETLAQSLTHLERAYLGVDEAFVAEGVDHVKMDNHEIRAILHPVYGSCIRFTTRISMPFDYDTTSRAMWRFITEEGLLSIATNVNKIHSTKDIQAQCFAFRLPESDPTREYWMNQVIRKHQEVDRTVIVGRSSIQPYVKDNRHPTGVSFVDDARVTISGSSSDGAPQTCVRACVYLVPDFGDCSSDKSVGIGELLEYFTNVACPVILRCREMVLTMLHQEAEARKQTAVRL